MAGFACGSDRDPPVTPTPGVSLPANPTPTPAELAWAERVCLAIQVSQVAAARVPEAMVDPTRLSLEERRSRAQSLWSALIPIAESELRTLESIAPPAAARALHEAIQEQVRVPLAEWRRSLEEIDAIFASTASVDANNLRLQQRMQEALRLADRAYVNSPPGVRGALRSTDACIGTGLRPDPTPTPRR
ncbi:MAG TPA: hypothetical protein VNN10_01690 [Dehalococcoidia bacterium]|nr:hypothetical protein [Dehalococcoidia bacterium]